MDICGESILTLFFIDVVCCAYLVKQLAKGVVWLMKLMIGDELLGEKRKCTCRGNDYRCRKCGLQFNHYEITAEDEKERDLCPACCKPLGEEDRI